MNEKAGYKQLEGPPSLLAIILAARAAGDKSLERAAKKELAERCGIDVAFRRTQQQEAAHAS